MVAKVTSPDERARQIATPLYLAAPESVVEDIEKRIAAHLRAYGEEEFKRGIRTANSPVIVSGPSKIEELMKPYGDKREADGFRRGVEEAKKILVMQWPDGSAKCLDKKHRPTCHYETVRYVNDKIEELQRGQEGER